jgi:hypothetical protein
VGETLCLSGQSINQKASSADSKSRYWLQTEMGYGGDFRIALYRMGRAHFYTKHFRRFPSCGR